MRVAALLALALAGPAVAQDSITNRIFDDRLFGAQPRSGGDMTSQEQRVDTSQGRGAVVRGLDKVTGEVRDVELAQGESTRLGLLSVTVGECRYPTSNPSGNAFAYLTVQKGGGAPQFQGWMVAASPALNALEDPRYDVWVMRCIM